MKISDKIIIIALEATCWEGKPPEGEESEIIEIGICLLDTITGALSQNKGILVRPIQSRVSAFCTQLTTITPEQLEREGISFATACAMLQQEYDARQYTWASYGGYDRKTMAQQCRTWDISYPLSEDHINVKELLATR